MIVHAFTATAEPDGSVTIVRTEARDGAAPTEVERWRLDLAAAGALAGDIVRAAMAACSPGRSTFSTWIDPAVEAEAAAYLYD